MNPNIHGKKRNLHDGERWQQEDHHVWFHQSLVSQLTSQVQQSHQTFQVLLASIQPA